MNTSNLERMIAEASAADAMRAAEQMAQSDPMMFTACVIIGCVMVIGAFSWRAISSR